MNDTNQPATEVIQLALPPLNDTKDLYAAYMPFIKGGGFFIPGSNQNTRLKREIQLGDEVLMWVILMKEKLNIKGRVVWITPTGQNLRKAGIGVQFTGPEQETVRNKIETLLAGFKSDQPPHTL